jgi:hypothetical protein
LRIFTHRISTHRISTHRMYPRLRLRHSKPAIL